MKNTLLYFISLCVALMVFTSIQIYSVTPSRKITESSKPKRELNILTWNIYMLPYCSLVNGNCIRARGIAKDLAASDYDIIVFEEAFDVRAREILRRKLSDKYPYMYGPANKLPFSLRTNSGIWVLSKIPLLKLEEIEYTYRFGIDAMARKGAVLFEGKWQGQTFQLAGTHLQSDSPDTIRHKQCGEIASKLLKKYARPNIPQIICGDFNIEMDDLENYQYMLHTLDAENGNLDGDVHTSFDEIDNELAKRENGKKRLIDYVLVRNSGMIKEIKRRVTVFKECRNNVSFDLSDHYAMEVRIHFEPASDFVALLQLPIE